MDAVPPCQHQDLNQKTPEYGLYLGSLYGQKKKDLISWARASIHLALAEIEAETKEAKVYATEALNATKDIKSPAIIILRRKIEKKI